MCVILTITPTPEARFERVNGAGRPMTTIDKTTTWLSERGVLPAG
jgi:hypothetical protein